MLALTLHEICYRQSWSIEDAIVAATPDLSSSATMRPKVLLYEKYGWYWLGTFVLTRLQPLSILKTPWDFIQRHLQDQVYIFWHSCGKALRISRLSTYCSFFVLYYGRIMNTAASRGLMRLLVLLLLLYMFSLAWQDISSRKKKKFYSS